VNQNNQQHITIITGNKGAGKSTLIKNLVTALRQEGYSIRGILSPGFYQGENKVAILVENQTNGDTRQLAIHDPGWDTEWPAREWRFDPEILKWGDEVLASIQTTCNVLVVDEIGYLELEKGAGWQSVFALLQRNLFTQAILVVRRSLLPLALKRWEHADVVSMQEIGDNEAWIEKFKQSLRMQTGSHRGQSQKRL